MTAVSMKKCASAIDTDCTVAASRLVLDIQMNHGTDDEKLLR